MLSFFAAGVVILLPTIGRADDSPGQKARDVIRGIGQGIRDAIHDARQPADVDVSVGETHMGMPTIVDAGEITFTVTNVGTEKRQFKISGPGLERYFPDPLPPGESQEMTVNLQPGEYIVEAQAVGGSTNELTAVARETE